MPFLQVEIWLLLKNRAHCPPTSVVARPPDGATPAVTAHMNNNPAAPYVPGRRKLRPDGTGHVPGHMRFGQARFGLGAVIPDPGISSAQPSARIGVSWAWRICGPVLTPATTRSG